MANRVAQWQIVTQDPEGLAAFYSRLFGWTVDSNNAMGYRTVRSDGIPGGIWPRGQEGHNLVQLFVEVDDIDTYLARATSLGATILMGRQQLPDGDALAFLVDPAGLSVGLYTPASRPSASSRTR